RSLGGSRSPLRAWGAPHPRRLTDPMSTVGLDLGGTKTLGVAVSGDGTVLAEQRRPTPAGLDELVSEMATMIEDLRNVVPAGDPVRAVGVGAAGLVTRDGEVRYAPNIHAFVDAPLQAVLAAAVKLPVIVDNDANMAAWG